MGLMRHTRTFLVAAVFVLALASVALASSGLGPAAGPRRGPSEALLLLQIVLLILTGRLLGEALLGLTIEILVPITGSGPSRRAAEVALALAQAASAPITALAIANAGAQSMSEDRHARDVNAEILREIERLAGYFAVNVRGLIGEGDTHEAIRKAVGKGHCCLIVFGASRRPGDSLSLGPLPAGLLDQSEHALLLISS